MVRVAVGKFYCLSFDKDIYFGKATATLVRLPFSSSLDIPLENKSLIHCIGGFLGSEGLWIVISDELLNQGGNIDLIVPKEAIIENKPPPKTFVIEKPNKRINIPILKQIFSSYTYFKLIAEK